MKTTITITVDVDVLEKFDVYRGLIPRSTALNNMMMKEMVKKENLETVNEFNNNISYEGGLKEAPT